MLPETKESLLTAIKVMELQIKTLKTLVENESTFNFGTVETTPYYPYYVTTPYEKMDITCNSKPEKTSPSKDIKVTTTPLNM